MLQTNEGPDRTIPFTLTSGLSVFSIVSALPDRVAINQTIEEGTNGEEHQRSDDGEAMRDRQ
jgi:hypothetical protein